MFSFKFQSDASITFASLLGCKKVYNLIGRKNIAFEKLPKIVEAELGENL